MAKKWLNMAQNEENSPKWPKVAQNGWKWPEIAKMAQNGENSWKWPKMAKKCHKMAKMAENGSKWRKWPNICPKWRKWLQMTENEFLISFSFVFMCLLYNDGSYCLHFCLACFCLSALALLVVYFVLEKNISSPFVGLKFILFPDGVSHWHYVLDLLGCVAMISPPGVSGVSFLTNVIVIVIVITTHFAYGKILIWTTILWSLVIIGKRMVEISTKL